LRGRVSKNYTGEILFSILKDSPLFVKYISFEGNLFLNRSFDAKLKNLPSTVDNFAGICLARNLIPKIESKI